MAAPSPAGPLPWVAPTDALIGPDPVGGGRVEAALHGRGEIGRGHVEVTLIHTGEGGPRQVFGGG